eukprot:CAMPEP_0170181092 /NCGR_PEP_ID=MMETSP0040_2-20121228/23939_1 /TAXON_ID=641309 /ORGANISM="Lotharella oceanica, Strain CCMP622" /LENGTH=173 /DNA_ID=CAMNT_0010425987 /DNA_START=3 /DNA_END=527 /DNA_ORIENTATION=+
MTHYELLGVEAGADDDEIRKAYKAAALRYHPDKHLESAREPMRRVFDCVVEAFKVLSDAKRRKEYDREIQAKDEIPVAYEATVSELEREDDEEGEDPTFLYPCRCGNEFEIPEEELEQGYEIFSCPGCSLNLRILKPTVKECQVASSSEHKSASENSKTTDDNADGKTEKQKR